MLIIVKVKAKEKELVARYRSSSIDLFQLMLHDRNDIKIILRDVVTHLLSP